MDGSEFSPPRPLKQVQSVTSGLSCMDVAPKFGFLFAALPRGHLPSEKRARALTQHAVVAIPFF